MPDFAFERTSYEMQSMRRIADEADLRFTFQDGCELDCDHKGTARSSVRAVWRDGIGLDHYEKGGRAVGRSGWGDGVGGNSLRGLTGRKPAIQPRIASKIGAVPG